MFGEKDFPSTLVSQPTSYLDFLKKQVKGLHGYREFKQSWYLQKLGVRSNGRCFGLALSWLAFQAYQDTLRSKDIQPSKLFQAQFQQFEIYRSGIIKSWDAYSQLANESSWMKKRMKRYQLDVQFSQVEKSVAYCVENVQKSQKCLFGRPDKFTWKDVAECDWVFSKYVKNLNFIGRYDFGQKNELASIINMLKYKFIYNKKTNNVSGYYEIYALIKVEFVGVGLHAIACKFTYDRSFKYMLIQLFDPNKGYFEFRNIELFVRAVQHGRCLNYSKYQLKFKKIRLFRRILPFFDKKRFNF